MCVCVRACLGACVCVNISSEMQALQKLKCTLHICNCLVSNYKVVNIRLILSKLSETIENVRKYLI